LVEASATLDLSKLVCPEDCRAPHDDARIDASIKAGLEYLFAASPPTALLAMSDRIALLALDWLRERGLSVPGDVSIVGFDGVPEAASSEPPLTTVAQPIAQMGRLAVQMILDDNGKTRREMLDVELVLRASTAPPPIGRES